MSTPPLHPHEPEPRLPTLSSDQMRPEWLATLGRIPGEGLKGAGFPHHVLGQLMHSPDLLGPFLEWWVSAKSAMALSVREQELVILRMGCLYASDYVWKHHVPVALEFAISAEEIQALREGRFTGFPPRERALLELAEAMVEQRWVSRELWERQGQLLAPREVVDLITLVAQYVLFALTNNVLQVQVEAPLQAVQGLGEG